MCFPVLEQTSNERLRSLCQEAGVSPEQTARLLREGSRHRPEDIEQVQHLATMLIHRELAMRVADDELGKLSVNLAHSYEELSLLYRISGSMDIAAPPQEFVHNICSDLLEVMNVQGAAGVVSAHPPALARDVVVLAGDIDLNLDQAAMLATLVSGQAGDPKNAMLDNHFVPSPLSGLGASVTSLAAVPLMVQSRRSAC